jgi:hypothetical protein
MSTTPAVWLALLAAALFGASTPFVKLLVGDGSALALAGCSTWAAASASRRRGYCATAAGRQAGCRERNGCWFGGAIAFGGVLGPLLLVVGLGQNSRPARLRCCSTSRPC